MSTINRQFSQAVQRLIQICPSLYIHGGESSRPVNCHSNLMLSWAPTITELHLATEIHALSPIGLPAFAAASQLTDLKLWVAKPFAYNYADALLQRCTCLLSLSCYMYLEPTVFPASLQRLEIYMPYSGSLGNFHMLATSAASDAFILLLAQAPHLQHLTLQLRDWGVLPSLKQLPILQHLTVSFSLEKRETGMDLSWLKAQPCRELWVHVYIGSVPVRQLEVEVADQLLQVPMHKCRLTRGGWIVPPQQEYWQHVSASQRMILYIDGCMDPLLHVLPSGPELHIKLKHNMVVSWHALVKAGNCVVIE